MPTSHVIPKAPEATREHPPDWSRRAPEANALLRGSRGPPTPIEGATQAHDSSIAFHPLAGAFRDLDGEGSSERSFNQTLFELLLKAQGNTIFPNFLIGAHIHGRTFAGENDESQPS